MEQSHLQGLEPIRPLEWADVFAFWRGNEEGNPDWVQHAKDRGFPSWEAWRMTYVKQARLDERAWNLYRVIDPLVSVPSFLGGPFRAWMEGIYGDSGATPPFAKIAERLKIVGNKGVSSLLETFPTKTTVSGIVVGNEIMIFEGMHRCSALAIAAAEKLPVTTELQITLGSALPGDDAMIATIVEANRKSTPTTRG